jgi:transposase
MLHVGLDLSRRRLDYIVLAEDGTDVDVGAAPPDADGLRGLATRLAAHGEPISAVIESMTGARFVCDTLERFGWEVDVADAQKVKGLAPLACKTDRVDARVLAELSRLDLVPAIWLPDPAVRAERERARWRLFLVRQRVRLKQRVHSTLMAWGRPCPLTDLFGARGRELLDRLEVPEPWRSHVTTAMALIDDLDREITAIDRELRAAAGCHPYVSLLRTVPGIGPVLGYTIAAEVGRIERFASPTKLAGYTGLCPRVYQSGDSDRRGPLSKHGPRYLRWALIEAALGASRHPLYHARYERTKRRLGRQRGPRVAQVELARSLAHSIWQMLTRSESFAPKGASVALAA